ncbi:hypothetical protein EGR_10800 [Echinococcus granulosus]|uniref:Uncharacterized protein n=1 Tax=Echinococcus granulosus TaxID=6210 RepID=W6U7J4_ECHGR|nr:hypothetical protein EGR_10800 [Echinococcus granulosus]EUB54337.1 hypothetical protein EGR_10800 [Echinococcus granulosus]
MLSSVLPHCTCYQPTVYIDPYSKLEAHATVDHHISSRKDIMDALAFLKPLDEKLATSSLLLGLQVWEYSFEIFSRHSWHDGGCLDPEGNLQRSAGLLKPPLKAEVSQFLCRGRIRIKAASNFESFHSEILGYKLSDGLLSHFHIFNKCYDSNFMSLVKYAK